MVGGPTVGASLVGALSMMTNTGNHKGLPLHMYDRPNWYSFVILVQFDRQIGVCEPSRPQQLELCPCGLEAT